MNLKMSFAFKCECVFFYYYFSLFYEAFAFIKKKKTKRKTILQRKNTQCDFDGSFMTLMSHRSTSPPLLAKEALSVLINDS